MMIEDEFDLDEEIQGLNFINVNGKFPVTSGIFCGIPINKADWKLPWDKMGFIIVYKGFFNGVDDDEAMLLDIFWEVKLFIGEVRWTHKNLSW